MFSGSLGYIWRRPVPMWASSHEWVMSESWVSHEWVMSESWVRFSIILVPTIFSANHFLNRIMLWHTKQPQTLQGWHKDPRTCFAWDSVYERTFSKLPKMIQVQWKLQEQKDFCSLINGSFNQDRHSSCSKNSGGFGHKWCQLPPRSGSDAIKIPSNLSTRSLFWYSFLRSDHILTTQTTNNQKLTDTVTKVQTSETM